MSFCAKRTPQIISPFKQPKMFEKRPSCFAFPYDASLNIPVICQLKSNGFDEFHKLWFLFFNSGSRAGRFEKPNASVPPRPGRNGPRFVASDVCGGKRCVSGL
jgi:hypothetical protein